MKRLFLPLALVLAMGAIAPALATRATGQPRNGYYWLLDDAGRWQCRAVNNRRIQPHKKCIDAGAVKPKV
jgi:hypothetical protein